MDPVLRDLMPLVSSLLGFLAGGWWQRRKTDAEAEFTLGEGWQAIVKAQQDQIDRLRSEMDEVRRLKRDCEDALAEHGKEIARLQRQVDRLTTAAATAPQQRGPRRAANGGATA